MLGSIFYCNGHDENVKVTRSLVSLHTFDCDFLDFILFVPLHVYLWLFMNQQ